MMIDELAAVDEGRGEGGQRHTVLIKNVVRHLFFCHWCGLFGNNSPYPSRHVPIKTQFKTNLETILRQFRIVPPTLFL